MPRPRRLARHAALLALLAALGLPAPAAAQTPATQPLETFDDDPVGKPPKDWKTRSGEIEKVYTVVEENGNRFLHADGRGVSVTIGKDDKFDVKRFPVITWRWRVTELPKGGDERKKETGDSAAGFYVVFGGWPIPNTVKYVWSSTLPVGTRLESPFAGQTKIVVLRSGPEQLGQWVEERVNVVEDYRRFFAEDPGRPRGIGILSDSDNTKSRAVADYDDIVAHSGATSLSGGAGAPGQ